MVDAFETLFGFRDSFNRGNPELFGAWSVESHANALPAVFDAERWAGEAAAETEVLRARRSLKKAIGLGGGEEIQHGLNADGHGAIEGGGQRDFHFTRDFAAARRGTKRKQFRDREARPGVAFSMPGERRFANQLGFAFGGAADAKLIASEAGILLQLDALVIRVTARGIEEEQSKGVARPAIITEVALETRLFNSCLFVDGGDGAGRVIGDFAKPRVISLRATQDGID